MDSFLEHFLGMSPLIIYSILFFSSFLENIAPPIPGDTVTVFGAYLVGIRRLDFIAVLVATTLGSLLGFMTLYFIGYKFGWDYFYKKNYRFLPRSRLEEVDKWFNRYGYVIILGNRFLSGIRSVISIFSGMSRLPWLRVSTLAFISCAVWNALLITAGYLLGDNWSRVTDFIKSYNQVVLVIIVITLILFFLHRKRSSRSGVSTRNNS